MSSSRPSLPRLSVPPPIEPKSRAVAYGMVCLSVLIALLAAYKIGPRAYNFVRLRQLRGHEVYDPSLDPVQTLQKAQADAQRNGRKILVVLGGNWCQWCLSLDHLMRTDEEIKEHLGKHFVVVKLDSAKAKVLDDQWGKPTRFGVPVLIFLDANGKVEYVQETGSLERWAGRILAHDPDRVLAMLKSRI
jgi:thiol:disulfide interchange protein